MFKVIATDVVISKGYGGARLSSSPKMEKVFGSVSARRCMTPGLRTTPGG